MSTGLKLKNMVVAVFLSSAILFAGIPAFGDSAAQSQQQSRKAHSKKKQAEPPPPLPSGPTGRPVPPMPLDAMAAVPPQVTFENNQLTIVAPNSTLGDILKAVRKQTGAEIEVPSAPERVVTHLGPGPAREVLADLLNGSRFNYVLLGSPSDEAALTRVVLVAKSGVQQEVAPSSPGTPGAVPPQTVTQTAVEQPELEPAPEANETEAADDNNTADDNTDQQPAEAEQTTPPETNGVKTPQQMLQEMQQRQMQMQQQQPPNQPGITGSGMPPHPPQEN
jgi:hypothetical protein